jgi:hypothetical protein
MSIAHHRLLKHVGIQTDDDTDNLSLANKGLDAINLSNAIHQISVKSKIHHL